MFWPKPGFPCRPKPGTNGSPRWLAIKALPDSDHYALLLPMNEWQVPVILGLQRAAELLRDEARFGNFQPVCAG
jgi:multiple sugar transport system substrate-binding protein